MQLSLRASLLRIGVERAARTPATVTEVGPGRVRISVPIASTLTIAGFQEVLAAAQQGDDWGSGGTGGVVTVWTELEEQGSP